MKSRLAVVAAALACLSAAPGVASGAFTESIVIGGLDRPTSVRFASDGRVFVAQKSGVILEYDSLADTTPTTVADLRGEVNDYWDRGLLSLALDPSFPSSPYVYALYDYDAPPGGTAPTWNDACPSPPGPTSDGCVVTGKLVRLTLSGNTATGQKVLLSGWCQQFPSHSLGDLRFGSDGALYVSGGDGASFDYADYGQGGGSSGSPTPKNPCGDPPAGVGGTMTPPTAEGGALRSQSVRRPAGEPVALNGAVLRLDPATGNAAAGNPLGSSSDPNARRIVAYGFRNPFRFAIKPLTSELWVGDVGWNDWEEIDRAPSPTATVKNFGWPCYEGVSPQPGYQAAGLNLCTSLYGGGDVPPPYFTYNHYAEVASGDGCSWNSGSSVTGLAFYTGGSYPSSYTGGLFFADYSRQCIWFMPVGGNGLPDPAQVQFFASASAPVDLEIGPGGDLFYADLNGGTIRRIAYAAVNHPPIAVASASPTVGPAPLTVQLDGSGSSDPDPGDTISYSWDLDGDGLFGDSTGVAPSHTYFANGTYTVRLKVTDSQGVSKISAPITIVVSPDITSTFGTATPGTATDTASAGVKEVSRYAAPTPGAILKVTGYVSGLGAASGTQPVRAVVYDDDNGAPGALLGASNEVLVPAGQPWDWVDFTFPAPVPIGAGTLWIGYLAGDLGGLVQLRYDASPGELRYNANTGGYAAGPSNPFGAASSSSKHYSLNATYVPSGANTPPVPAISTPSSSLTWKVGDTIGFSGSATDPQEGPLPASALTWTLILHHCGDTGQNCHTHTVQSTSGVASGSFAAPDHEYPSYLEVQLKAIDAGSLTGTSSVTLQPQTVNLSLASAPVGLQLTINGFAAATPFARTVIVGSTNSLSAGTPQALSGTSYSFASWSDGGAQTHNIVAPATATTYTATFSGPPPPGNTPPIVVASASPTSGAAPLAVAFDGSGSSDPDPGDTITYSWDLDGNGVYGDSTLAKPSKTYTAGGTYSARLRVTDSHGASTTSAPITIAVTTTFGVTAPGTLTDLAPANGKEVARFTAPKVGTVSKLTGYISGLGSTIGSQRIKAILYADSGGKPGARIGASGEVTINAKRPWGWVDFTFATPVPVTAGTLWLGYIASTKTSLIQMRYAQLTNDSRSNLNAGGYAAGPSNPFGVATTSTKHYSIYATFLPQ